MNDFEFRHLAEWSEGDDGDEMRLAVPLPVTSSGMTLRWCPNDDCQPRRFQIGVSQLEQPEATVQPGARRSPGAPATTCPYCGTDGDDQSFVAPEDLEAAIDKVKWAFREDVVLWLDGLAADFNRTVSRGGNNFLGIRMTSDNVRRPEPTAWREDLLRSVQCHACSRAYGVYAIGLFCPDCGIANLADHFAREVDLVEGQVSIAADLQIEGETELAYRVLGNAHEDVVTAFETYLKSVFRFVLVSRQGSADLFKPADLRGNPFQNLSRAERLFAALGIALFEGLDPSELQSLETDFQKRHVVGHNLGLVDDRYAEVEQDSRIGETTSLLAGDVKAFATRCMSVVRRLEAAVPELGHPGR